MREATITQERIRRGEITSATEARRQALTELGREVSADVPAMNPRSPYLGFGQAIYELRKANKALADDNPGRLLVERLRNRLEELKDALAESERLIDKWANSDPESPNTDDISPGGAIRTC